MVEQKCKNNISPENYSYVWLVFGAIWTDPKMGVFSVAQCGTFLSHSLKPKTRAPAAGTRVIGSNRAFNAARGIFLRLPDRERPGSNPDYCSRSHTPQRKVRSILRPEELSSGNVSDGHLTIWLLLPIDLLKKIRTWSQNLLEIIGSGKPATLNREDLFASRFGGDLTKQKIRRALNLDEDFLSVKDGI